MARLRAVVVIHAPGLSGMPSRGQRSSGDHERVLDGLLGEVEVAQDPDQGRDRPARLLPEQAVDGLVRGARPPLGQPAVAARLGARRVLGREVDRSVGPRSSRAARPGSCAAISIASSRSVAEICRSRRGPPSSRRTVRRSQRLPVSDPDRRRGRRRLEGLTGPSRPRLADLLGEGVVRLHHCLGGVGRRLFGRFGV